MSNLGILPSLISAGAAVTSATITASTMVYNSRQDRKFQEAMASSANDMDLIKLVAQRQLQDEQLALQEKQIDAQIAIADSELAKLEEEHKLQLEAQKDQLDWIKAERARQQAIADEESAIRLAILEEQKKQVVFEGEIAQANRDAAKAQLEQMRSGNQAEFNNVRTARETLSDTTLKDTGAKKSKTPLVVGAVAAAGAALYVMSK